MINKKLLTKVGFGFSVVLIYCLIGIMGLALMGTVVYIIARIIKYVFNF